MKLVYDRCAGLDVHKKSVNVCIRKRSGKTIESDKALFATFTSDLERLRDYLRKHKIRRVVMESTGVYWIPVWNVLERAEWNFDLVLVNPQHVRALPGKKTDQLDCERLAELGQYDMLRGSFIPPRNMRELRDLTRRRVYLQGERNRAINRISRLAETANVKLSSVASNIVGKTGWLILNAIAAGHSKPEQLAELAQGTLKRRTEELAVAVTGYITPHFRWMLKQALEDLSRLDEDMQQIDDRIRQHIGAHADVIRRLRTIPGVDEITAWALVAELGTDMTQFVDADHAASWAGLCPGNCESAGKRQSGRTRQGNRYLRRALIQSAWAVTHKKDCYLTAVFYRVCARRGMKRAAMSVAHRILRIAYVLLRDGGVYVERGGSYFDQLNPERTAKRLIQRLTAIGYEGEIRRTTPIVAEACEVDAAATAPTKSKRGRPRRVTPPPFGTLKWSGQLVGGQSSSTKSPRDKAAVAAQNRPAATPDLCPKCAAWRIACIHVKKQKSQAVGAPDSLESGA